VERHSASRGLGVPARALARLLGGGQARDRPGVPRERRQWLAAAQRAAAAAVCRRGAHCVVGCIDLGVLDDQVPAADVPVQRRCEEPTAAARVGKRAAGEGGDGVGVQRGQRGRRREGGQRGQAPAAELPGLAPAEEVVERHAQRAHRRPARRREARGEAQVLPPPRQHAAVAAAAVQVPPAQNERHDRRARRHRLLQQSARRRGSRQRHAGLGGGGRSVGGLRCGELGHPGLGGRCRRRRVALRLNGVLETRQELLGSRQPRGAQQPPPKRSERALVRSGARACGAERANGGEAMLLCQEARGIFDAGTRAEPGHVQLCKHHREEIRHRRLRSVLVAAIVLLLLLGGGRRGRLVRSGGLCSRRQLHSPLELSHLIEVDTLGHALSAVDSGRWAVLKVRFSVQAPQRRSLLPHAAAASSASRSTRGCSGPKRWR
jgi:hypothetical protein